jgi:hypothetical protein
MKNKQYVKNNKPLQRQTVNYEFTLATLTSFNLKKKSVLASSKPNKFRKVLSFKQDLNIVYHSYVY